uniref:Nuclear receptor subfamily 1 group D member 1 n=1 Tax=Plectus sambesii TaxID=2011161 RepID=A0A914WCS4_9BILA
MDLTKVCVVCGDSSDGIHFHVESCRACAAFFRRTIALNKLYKCLHENSCAINKTIRCMCRSCRFRKCLSMGMDKEAVQPSRDAIGKHQFNKKRRRQVVQLESDGHRQDSPVTEGQNQPSCSYQAASPSIQPSLQQSLPYLSGMQIAYRNLLERRRIMHGQQTIHGLFENDQTEPLAANFDKHIDCQHKEFGMISEMLNGCGHFRELPVDEKCAMFKRFFVQFLATERAYETLKAFGPNTTRYLMANRSYIDVNNLQQFFENATIANKDPQAAARMFGTMVDQILNNLIKPMGAMNITEMEFLALLGQLLWSSGLSDMTAETSALAKKTRETIFLELQAYYASTLEENCFVRFGNLMLLLPSVNAIHALMKENFRMITIFGMIETDKIFEELLLA